MSKAKNLPSEQLPNDGSFYVPQYFKEANEDLESLGKRGCRCMLKKSGNTVSFQFSWQGKQKNPGSGESYSKHGIEAAKQKAIKITSALVSGTYSDEWLQADVLGKKNAVQKSETEEPTFRELFDKFKTHWQKENKNLKSQKKAYSRRVEPIERAVDDEPIAEATVKRIIESTAPNSHPRRDATWGLKEFLEYCDRYEPFKKKIEAYQKRNKPEKKLRNIPDDRTIVTTYFEKIFDASSNPNKRNAASWQFVYGLLATYGLRIHEAWNIANWDSPVILQNGDWVKLETDDNEVSQIQVDRESVIPAILDSSNTEKLLCIRHNTKTGYRVAFPLSPDGQDWLKLFDLIQPMNLPPIRDPLNKKGKTESSYYCSQRTCRNFRDRQFGFPPHALRHAYNHRGHSQGINLTMLSQSLGHSLEQNSTTYLNTMPQSVRIKNMKEAMKKISSERTELEVAREKIKFLEAQVKHLEVENEKLKLELRLLNELGLK